MRKQPMTAQDCGKAMRKYREDIGMSIWTLGQMSGVHPNTISNYELGNYGPSLANIVALADALDISIDKYIGRKA